MVLGMALFCANDIMVKLSSAYWPTGQILMMRGIFAVLMLVLALVVSGLWRSWRLALRPLVILRAAVEGTIAVLFISALRVLPLSDITAILLVAPLMITAFSAILLKESVGWRRWLAVIAGFAGVLIVVRPLGHFEIATLLAFGSAVLVAVRDLLTRQLPQEVPSLLVTLTTTIGSCSAGVLLSLGAPLQPFAVQPLLLLAGAALVLTAGNFAVVIACRTGELSVVSPFRYSVILWAILGGAIVFGDRPDGTALAGMALIVGSGLYTLHRERVRRRSVGPPDPARPLA